MESQASNDAQPSPTSLPGRDHMADADNTLIRKRPRLTPPQYDDKNNDSLVPTATSPLVIEVITLDDHADPLTEIITMDDETSVHDGSLASFPFVSDRRKPDQAAAHFASICCNSDNVPIKYEDFERFASWIQTHVATTSTFQSHQRYAQEFSFWSQVGHIFDSLATIK